MKYYIILFGTLLFLGLFGCTPFTEQKITHPEDYSRFLNYDKKTNKNLSHIDEGLIFWEAKIKDQPNSHLYLLKKSDLLAKRFRISGNVEDLLVSDSLLNIANKITKGKYANIYHRMSTNAITKHQFRKARQFLQEASKLGENKQTTLLMTFDVDMETGYQQYGDDHLSRIGNKNSFDYLFRYAQYMDHTGKLDSAIYFIEKAMDRVKNEKNVSLQCWALTNLGDMYGHNNQVSEAYQCYLNTLNLDPYYAYALKGIAKIAYAHDLDIVASNEIIDFLHSQYNWPDL